MKRIINLAFLAIMIMGTATLFTSCGSDENGSDNNGNNGNAQINPKKVFKGGLPKDIGGSVITVNSKGLVEKIDSKEYNWEVNFEYKTTDTRNTGKTPDVVMTVNNEEGKKTFYMLIGSNGFVKHAYTIDEGNTESEEKALTWDFDYDNEGHLIKTYYSQEKTTTTLKYEGGNLVEITKTYKDNENKKETYNVFYTSKNISMPMVNIGCLTFYSLMMKIDIDEMEITYYAGLLGTSTKNLPQRIIDKNGDIKGIFEWSLNAQAYPIQCKITKEDEKVETFNIHW